MRILTYIFLVLILSIENAASENSEPLERLLADIDSITQRHHIPGMSLAIVHADSLMYAGGKGYANLEEEIVFSAETMVRAGSVSKLLVAMAAMQLVEDDLLELSRPLSEYEEYIPFQNPWEESHPVLLEHLLTHTSGFDDIRFNELYGRLEHDVDYILHEQINKNPSSRTSRWKPGSRFSYSNSGYSAAAFFVEAASGLPYDTFIKEFIFNMAGMEEASFRLSPKIEDRLARSYKLSKASAEAVDIGQIYHKPSGNLYASALDMAAFLKLLLNEGNTAFGSVISAETLEQMKNYSPRPAIAAGAYPDYGIGLMRHFVDGIESYGHNGGIDQFYSNLQFFPQSKKGFFFSLTAMNIQAIYEITKLLEQFCIADAQRPELPEPLRISEQTAEQISGWYKYSNPRNSLFGFLLKPLSHLNVSVHQDTLIAKPITGRSKILLAAGPNIYRELEASKPTVYIATDEDGKMIFDSGENYFIKSSPLYLKAWSYSLLLGFGGILAGILTALISVAGRYFGKVEKKDMRHSYAFLIAGLAVFLCIWALVNLQPDTAGQANFLTYTVFFTSLIFAFATIGGNYFFWKNIKDLNIKPLSIFIQGLISLSFLWITLYLTYHKIIGIRLWHF